MKLKKVFLGVALASLALATSAVTANAAEDGLKEDFNYSADGIGTVGGSNAYNIYAKSNVANEFCNLEQVDGLDVLHFGVKGNGDDTTATTPKLQIRDNASAANLFNQEGKSIVINTKYKTTRTYSKCFYVYDSTFGTIQITEIKNLAANTWHDLTVVLTSGGTNNTGVVYAYANGALLAKKDVAADKAYSGKLTEVGFQTGKSDFTYEEGFYIDYVYISEYVGATATVDATKTTKVGESFELAPQLSAEASISTYNVKVADETVLTYEGGKFWGQTEGKTTVTFDFVDENIKDVTTEVTVEKAASDILVSDVTLNSLFADNFTLTVGQSFETAKLFAALPTTATNLELLYTVEGDAVTITEGKLVAAKAGTAKVKATAADSGAYQEEFTVTVNAGNFTALNDFEVGSKWDKPTAELTYTGWEASEYTGTYARVFTEMNIVEDELFGKAIEYTGVGSSTSNEGTSTGGAALIKHIPASELTPNKDYKITGWAKVDTTGDQTAPKTRVDVKVYAYKLVDGAPSYLAGNPYSAQMTSLTNFANTGWVQFELPIVNADSQVVDGFKVEVITWNCQQNTKAYATNLALVELDSCTNVGWKATVDGNAITETPVEVKLGTELELALNAVPSASTLPSLTVTSSDEAVVKFENGKLVTLSAGQATVTITDGTKNVVLTLVVKNDATNVTLDSTNIELEVGAYEEYQLVITPADATSTFEAVSSNPEGLTVVIEGKSLSVLANKAGTYTVTITSLDNSEVKVEVTIVVKEKAVTPPTTTTPPATTTPKPSTTTPKPSTTTPVQSTTSAPTTTTPQKTNKGCFGSLAGSLIALITLTGAVVLSRKRRK